jgi:hypothetical protein
MQARACVTGAISPRGAFHIVPCPVCAPAPSARVPSKCKQFDESYFDDLGMTREEYYNRFM